MSWSHVAQWLPVPTDLEQVDDYATEFRYILRVEESGPINNLTSVVEHAGVCLVPIVGLAGVDGISAWVDDVPVIGLDPTVPGDRFRLSLGHELGHLSFHVRSSAASEGEANRFASALMFPTEEFLAAMPVGTPMLRDFIGLKKAWGFSVAALVYRAHELGVVDDRRYRALQIQMSKWRRNEPAAMKPVHGTLFGRLVEVNGGPAQVAADLGVNAAHLRLLMGWSHIRLA
ncbi:MAG: Helix-turn-helix domain protein [Acidimicrobiales bacterium]|nr:Helix-turn-helix domain protein [Acidimicrobiales bacterium]